MLLEVVLGLAIFCVAALFVMRLFPATDQAVAHAERVSQATQLARKLMDGELAQPYSNLSTFTGTAQIKYGDRRGSDLVLDCNYRVDVQELDAVQKYKSIVVNVSWDWGSGISKVSRNVMLESRKGAMW